MLHDHVKVAACCGCQCVPLPSAGCTFCVCNMQQCSPCWRTKVLRVSCAYCCRVHLQLLGHPIANDEQYGGTYPGPTQIKMRGRWERETEGQPTNEQPAKRQRCEADTPAATASIHTCSSAEQPGGPAEQQAVSSQAMENDEAVDFARLQAVGSLGVKPDEFVVPEQLTDELCWQCPWLVPDGYPTELVPMWLHAHRYSTPDWTFECPAPHWADLDWIPPTSDNKQLSKEDL